MTNNTLTPARIAIGSPVITPDGYGFVAQLWHGRGTNAWGYEHGPVIARAARLAEVGDGPVEAAAVRLSDGTTKRYDIADIERKPAARTSQTPEELAAWMAAHSHTKPGRKPKLLPLPKSPGWRGTRTIPAAKRTEVYRDNVERYGSPALKARVNDAVNDYRLASAAL
jgi:hypothetical protein